MKNLIRSIKRYFLDKFHSLSDFKTLTNRQARRNFEKEVRQLADTILGPKKASLCRDDITWEEVQAMFAHFISPQYALNVNEFASQESCDLYHNTLYSFTLRKVDKLLKN